MVKRKFSYLVSCSLLRNFITLILETFSHLVMCQCWSALYFSFVLRKEKITKYCKIQTFVYHKFSNIKLAHKIVLNFGFITLFINLQNLKKNGTKLATNWHLFCQQSWKSDILMTRIFSRLEKMIVQHRLSMYYLTITTGGH